MAVLSIVTFSSSLLRQRLGPDMFLQFPSDEWFMTVLFICAVVCQQEGCVKRVDSDGISVSISKNSPLFWNKILSALLKNNKRGDLRRVGCLSIGQLSPADVITMSLKSSNK